MSQENQERMEKKSSQMVKITLVTLLVALLFLIELYEIINDPANMIVIGALGVFLLVSVYVEMVFIRKQIEGSEKEQEEAFDNVYRSEKASYLLIRKYFDQMDQKMKNLSEPTNIPYKELIAAQKALAKAQINRGKQNTNALLISNDRMMQRINSIQNEISEMVRNASENNPKINEQNQTDFIEGNKEVLEKQQDILAGLKELETSLRNEILESVDKIASMKSQQMSVPQMQIQEHEDIQPLDVDGDFSFDHIQDLQPILEGSSESDLDNLLLQMDDQASLEPKTQSGLPQLDQSEEAQISEAVPELQSMIEEDLNLELTDESDSNTFEPNLQPMMEDPEMQAVNLDEPELQPIEEATALQPIFEDAEAPELQPVFEDAEAPELQPIFENAEAPELQPIFDNTEVPELQPILKNTEASELQSMLEDIEQPELNSFLQESNLQPVMETADEPELQPMLDNTDESELQPIMEAADELELQPMETADEPELQPIMGTSDGSELQPTMDTVDELELQPIMETAAEPELQPVMETADESELQPVMENTDEPELQPIMGAADELELQPVMENTDEPELRSNVEDSTLQTVITEPEIVGSLESQSIMEETELPDIMKGLEQQSVVMKPELASDIHKPEFAKPATTEAELQAMIDQLKPRPTIAEPEVPQIVHDIETESDKKESETEPMGVYSEENTGISNFVADSVEKKSSAEFENDSHEITRDRLAAMIANLGTEPILEETDSDVETQKLEEPLSQDFQAESPIMDDELEQIMKSMDIDNIIGDPAEDLDIDKILEVPLANNAGANVSKASSDQVMSSDEIAALIANTELLSEPEPVKKNDLPDLSDPRHVMSSDEIAALIANI